MTHEATIVSTARTAIGTAFKGSLVETDALDLATRTLTETVSRSGLDPALIPFEVLVNTADASPDRVVITGFTRAPGAVLRDGAPAASGWTYDGGSQTLTVEAPDGRTHLWSVQ